MKIGIVAGEASGNLLGADLLQALRMRQPNLSVSGIGGPDMIAAGCHSLFDMERLAVMGLVEPLRRLPELIKIRRRLYQHFTQQKPDVFIGIDSPDFNLGLELKLRKQGIPVVHYVSPSVWAWRQKRIHKIARATDMVLTLFPFEAAFYQKYAVPSCFVGHPLADMIPLQSDKIAARKALQLDTASTYIALLPGSRRNEIHFLAETFIKTALQCWQEKSTLKFITSAANKERDQEFQAHCRRLAPQLTIEFFVGQSQAVMAAADVVLVAAGTATLETLLVNRPMVIAYRMANLTYQIARHIVKTPYIGLPNLLAGESLVPEFIQENANPDNLMRSIFEYLENPGTILRLESRFTQIHQQLRCNASQQAAEAVLKLVSLR